MSIESIKAHFKKHRTTYIACGATAVVVGGVVYVIHLKRITRIAEEALRRATDIAAVPSSIDAGRDVIINSVLHNKLTRQGHPGYIVYLLEEDRLFSSQNQAAEYLGVSPSRLSNHLNGLLENVDGFHLRRVGIFPS